MGNKFALANIDGKPIAKLIEVVSNGIGTLYRPRKIKKEADAQAYAIKVKAIAEAEAEAETRMIEIDTEERISRRIAAKEIRRQDNIDSVVEMAANDLEGERVSEKPVDIDWSTRFFEIVQDVSREEMKLLWAKILAKETAQPSTFSMRTLEVLKNITAEEAATFERVSTFFLYQNDIFIYNSSDLLDRLGVHYKDLALLTECGLLQSGDFVNRTFISFPDKEAVTITLSGPYVIKLALPKGSNSAEIPIILLTKVGQELYSLIEHKTNKEYITAFANEIRKKAPSAIIQYSELVSIENGHVRYKNPMMDLR